MPADGRSPLKVLLLTDVFPPRSGGSGWSTYYLGKALVERGHQVRVMKPMYNAGAVRPTIRRRQFGGLPVEEVLVPDPPEWPARFGFAKIIDERAATRLMARRALMAIQAGEADVLHAQHAVSAQAASLACLEARRHGACVVSVATVRDYWPLCPVSTRLFTGSDGESFECKECHRLPAYLACATEGRGSFSLRRGVALARWVRTLRASRALAGCDAVVAVSDYVQRELARSGRVPPDKLHSIPNLVHLESVASALEGPWPLDDLSPDAPFLLYAGKLDLNKGALMLPELLQQAAVGLPLVLAGNGPLRSELAVEARERGLDFRFADWIDNDAVLLLMRRARALLFPSAWQEPLSRVLLEGCAAGAAIVALDTGGTGNIIVHMQSGWLAPDTDSFVQGVRSLVNDNELNGRLRAGARQRAEERFTSESVSAQVERLYWQLLERAGPR